MLTKEQVQLLAQVQFETKAYILPIYKEYQYMKALKFKDNMYTWCNNTIEDFEFTKTHVWINSTVFSDYRMLKMPIGWLSNKNWRKQAKAKLNKEHAQFVFKKLKQ